MKKIIFFGTPEISAKALQKFIEHSHIKVSAVVTNPDAAIGRKQIITPSPVKKLAFENDIPVFTPQNPSDELFLNELKAFEADFFIVISYGKILAQKLIDIPKQGTYNLHFSMLPLYRGASPVQAAILDGKQTSGISIFRIVPALDAGEIYIQQPHSVENKTTQQCLDEMIEIGSMLFQNLILEFEKYVPWKQSETEATFCKKISKNDGLIQANQETAQEIFQKFLAYTPWPGIYSIMNDGKRVIWKNIERGNLENNEERNTMFHRDGKVLLQSKNGTLHIKSMQIEGKNESTARIISLLS